MANVDSTPAAAAAAVAPPPAAATNAPVPAQVAPVVDSVDSPSAAAGTTAAETEAAAVAAVTAAAAATVGNGAAQVPSSPGVMPSSVPTTPGVPQSGQHTSASLYVGDLHTEVTENTLYEIFQAVGPVQSIRVCRDVVTRRSLGYAYINFHNIQDAERALDSMNYFASPLTKDKPLRIMWKIRDPSVRKTGAGNIFVKSLDKSIDNKALYDTFSQFGAILSCKVALSEHGESLGYGFVHFQTPEAAGEATSKVNGMLLAGKKVYVGKFLNKREREAAGQINKSFTNVYVKNLDESCCNKEKLMDVFSQYGDITSIYVPQDKESTKSKGFAFINFSNPEMAARAVNGMDGKDLEGKTLFVGRAQKRQERETELRNKYEQIRQERMAKYQGVNLYIKNLSDDIDDDELRAEFAKHGTITSCKVMRDDKGSSRGFGFVCFTQPEEATKAVTELNGRMVGKKPIYVALAQRKDVRRAQLEAQRSTNIRMPGNLPPGAMYAQPSPYMYQNAASMVQMGGPGGMPQGGRGYMNPGAHMVMGRGGPGGRGGPMATPYMSAMGRGQAPMHMAGPMMAPAYGMAAHRQPRQNRARPMGPGPQGQPGVQSMRGQGGRGRGGVPAGNQGYKYPQQGRQQMAPQNGMSQQRQPAAVQQQQTANGEQQYQDTAPLTLEKLTSATPHQQKQMLGEKLYPHIASSQPTLAGKITGMLLEMENPDILHMLESPEALAEQIDEALKVLRNHNGNGGDGAKAQAV